MSGLKPLSTIEEIDALSTGRTVPSAFLELVAAHPNVPALHSMKADGGWNVWTYQQFADVVAQAAAGLRSAGLQSGQRMLLMMRNRPDFHWFDAAAQFLSATPVSIYNSSSPEEIEYLAGHAEAEIAVVEDNGFLERILKVRDELPNLKQIYVIEPPEGPLPDGVHPASELLEAGTADLAELGAATSPSDLATLIYTSGTTGPPKGVMISQYNVVYTVEILKDCISFDDFVGKRAVSYLPMAHI
ncbi:MAG: AMP-binding protein, partial [Actinomycetota bacterium]